MSSTLPPSILAKVEMSPVEDLLLGLLPRELAGINVTTFIEEDQKFPFVLIRSAGSWGNWAGDPRFLDAAAITVATFCRGENADEDAALLAEAVRVTLRDSKNKVVPGRGHIVTVEMTERPRRVTDWATSAGPVQFADLPNDVMRWENTYHVIIRKPARKPFAS